MRLLKLPRVRAAISRVTCTVLESLLAVTVDDMHNLPFAKQQKEAPTVRKTLCGEEVDVPLSMIAGIRTVDRVLKTAVVLGVLYLFVEIAYAFFSGRVTEVLQ